MSDDVAERLVLLEDQADDALWQADEAFARSLGVLAPSQRRRLRRGAAIDEVLRRIATDMWQAGTVIPIRPPVSDDYYVQDEA